MSVRVRLQGIASKKVVVLHYNKNFKTHLI